MDKITEVGHKMRSAIKAKLIELGSYVDDELPDYIMVMVANHRSKEMMTEDLQLFLDGNTEIFVNWLHQVLQKLHEVTINSMEIPKIAKQEARLKRKIVASKKTKPKKIKKETSITDEIPVSANTIGSITLNIPEISRTPPIQDKFDIPSVTEVEKLAEIEAKIEIAKAKLANMEEEEEFIELDVPKHARITFSPPRKSVLERLGKRTVRLSDEKRVEDEFTGRRREKESIRKRDETVRKRDKPSVHDRIGSHVIPMKKTRIVETPPPPKSVSSVVQIKPRKILPKSVQPNNKLLFKAVAEAQKSVTMDHNEGKKKDSKQQNIVVKVRNEVEEKIQENFEESKPRFIVTLDGLDESIFRKEEIPKEIELESSKIEEIPKIMKLAAPIDRIKKAKRQPSPITFSKSELQKVDEIDIPALKVKDRCKYWPGCRLGDTCEYSHPTQLCKMFPACKFGDRCLYIHPPCKFGITCSRRGCPYTHGYVKPNKVASTVVPIANPDLCKYFPDCSNQQCQFYHPKPCRFGKFCLNKNECNFCHTEVVSKDKFKWKSK